MKTPFYLLAVYPSKFVASYHETTASAKDFSEKHLNVDDLVQVRTHEDLKDVKTDVLLRLVNGTKPADAQLKRFRDRQQAMKMGYTALTTLVAQGGESTPTTTQEATMAKKNNAGAAASETETEAVAETAAETETAVITPEQEARLAELSAKEAEIRESMTDAEKTYKAFTSQCRDDLNTIRKERNGINKASRKGGVKRTQEGETPTVTKVLDLLRRDEGATKKQLVDAVPEAKPAYISALLTGILAKKGYILEATQVEGARGKVYRVMGKTAAATA